MEDSNNEKYPPVEKFVPEEHKTEPDHCGNVSIAISSTMEDYDNTLNKTYSASTTQENNSEDVEIDVLQADNDINETYSASLNEETIVDFANSDVATPKKLEKNESEDPVIQILEKNRTSMEKTRLEKIEKLRSSIDNSLINAFLNLNINTEENNETFLSCNDSLDKTIQEYLCDSDPPETNKSFRKCPEDAAEDGTNIEIKEINAPVAEIIKKTDLNVSDPPETNKSFEKCPEDAAEDGTNIEIKEIKAPVAEIIKKTDLNVSDPPETNQTFEKCLEDAADDETNTEIKEINAPVKEIIKKTDLNVSDPPETNKFFEKCPKDAAEDGTNTEIKEINAPVVEIIKKTDLNVSDPPETNKSFKKCPKDAAEDGTNTEIKEINAPVKEIIKKTDLNVSDLPETNKSFEKCPKDAVEDGTNIEIKEINAPVEEIIKKITSFDQNQLSISGNNVENSFKERKVCDFIPPRCLSPILLSEAGLAPPPPAQPTPIKSPAKSQVEEDSQLAFNTSDSDEKDLLDWRPFMDDEELTKFIKQADLKLEINRLRQMSIKMQLIVRQNEANILRVNAENQAFIRKYEEYTRKNAPIDDFSLVWETLRNTKQELMNSENANKTLQENLESEQKKWQKKLDDAIDTGKEKRIQLIEDLDVVTKFDKMVYEKLQTTIKELNEKIDILSNTADKESKKSQQYKCFLKELEGYYDDAMTKVNKYKERITKLEEREAMQKCQISRLQAIIKRQNEKFEEQALSEANKENQILAANKP